MLNRILRNIQHFLCSNYRSGAASIIAAAKPTEFPAVLSAQQQQQQQQKTLCTYKKTIYSLMNSLPLPLRSLHFLGVLCEASLWDGDFVFAFFVWLFSVLSTRNSVLWLHFQRQYPSFPLCIAQMAQRQPSPSQSRRSVAPAEPPACHCSGKMIVIRLLC